MKQHKGKIILLLIGILIIGGIVWYQAPIKKNTTISMCSIEGECIELKLDVSWQRYILGATKFSGTITIGDEVYKSLNTNDNNSFVERIQEKWGELQGNYTTQIFYSGGNVLIENQIYILHMDKNLEEMYILLVNDGEGTIYYGPANTKEEAVKMQENRFSSNEN